MFKFITGLYIASCLLFTAGLYRFAEQQYKWDLAEENYQYVDELQICRVMLPNNSKQIHNKQCFATENALATIDQVANSIKWSNITFNDKFRFIRAKSHNQGELAKFNFNWLENRRWRKITVTLPQDTPQLYLQGQAENGTCIIKYGSNERTPLILFIDRLINYFIAGGTFLFTGAILYLFY